MDLVSALSLEHPIVLAPLGGGPSTPELVAAVSDAGGFGFVGAAYLTPDQIRDVTARVRALTSRPFGVNLFAGGWTCEPPRDVSAALALVAGPHERLGLPPPALPEVPPDPFPAQLEAVLDARPAAFSFTFGIPSRGALQELRRRGIVTLGTATCAREAQMLAAAGVDGVLAQGSEAGGHRGTFAASLRDGLVPTLRLVAEIGATSSLPIVATGGIMDGTEIADALDVGAAAAQLGTAFLACPESGASPVYKQALRSVSADTTVLTRAFSGRWARGLPNEFTVAGEAHWNAILPYPVQNQLTRAMRQAAARKGIAGLLSLWAGRGVARLRHLPAGDLVRALADELRSARESRDAAAPP
jgi:nitronate monooxygenase